MSRSPQEVFYHDSFQSMFCKTFSLFVHPSNLLHLIFLVILSEKNKKLIV